MRQHFIKWAIVNFLLVTFVGCATYPPPIILPDKATNFEYQYTVNVPQGWKVYKEVPKDFKSQMPMSAIKRVSLIMANKSTNGVILIINEKSYGNYQKVLDTPESKWREISDTMRTELEKYGTVSNYECHMDTHNFTQTYNNYKRDNTAFKPKSWLDTEADISATMQDWTLAYTWSSYPCHKRNTCQNLVMLISNMDNKDVNQSALTEVAESLEMHDVPTN